ncbi:acetyl-CoA carboxylase [Clostridium botulinum]|uniref:Biotin carboxylase n=2 Tax=Clostridium botulinum TaxID=1491 RepID=A0A9Q1V105_CLOBO|nr:acetyl-CoA carboxylase biotin carboxylase subunit [Clostridium botulinum]KEI02769.1 acetyl-CoA carboxylase [Clostridium botulinum D str. 16868]KEI03103.1 acetyl-CoA carboxylase [Clostridium botulinum C/D str. Sp77]KOA80174.1 acetyl-CoA carboxylase [Clostridium botulinum]KOA86588.1 acetyl-CoA carboxylase [Clostridium botulinum]KOA87799.1 acetyl-CoA carboxylase [Clostridium botulinum]
MFNKILIANRGEIAVRIIRACRELGIETVAVYSDIDKNALHVQMADEAVCIGPAKPSESYLNMENIISATVLTGAQAIHPGFGFLSENSKFAEMCNDCNIVFIGPDIDTMNNMGNKSKAREIMLKAQVPIVPGTEGDVDTVKDALKEAERIGYPVMIKAAAGGGGRGIRIVRTNEDLGKMFETAKREAEVAFGDGSMYMEKFVENPRHVEFQILGDNYGNVVHLGERDCSIQRRNQKVLEETPCPIMTEELREKMGSVAVRAAKAVKYKGAGTIEFLLDNKGDFYFMEMNTRIQVEHPITEMVTGIDLIKEQIKVASGKELNVKQEDIRFEGHSIECRVNAENPAKGFMPSPGIVNITCIPGGSGIRIDSALYQGYKMPPNYDSMIAKLIVHGKNRDEAISKMKRALEEFVIDGIDTNISFQFEILNNENFVNGTYNTGFINNEFGY